MQRKSVFYFHTSRAVRSRVEDVHLVLPSGLQNGSRVSSLPTAAYHGNTSSLEVYTDPPRPSIVFSLNDHFLAVVSGDCNGGEHVWAC